jgi:small subunit ribosomal protein S1
MNNCYLPEGGRYAEPRNRELLASRAGLERAMNEGIILEAPALLCDSDLCLHVDLGCMRGIIPKEEAALCREGEELKPIAVITRVGKPVACKILAIEHRDGAIRVQLSRRAAQKECMSAYMKHLREGDVIPARVTHMEPFGAFLDIGCGVSSLLSVDCISVSRIRHPGDRLYTGMLIRTVVKVVDEKQNRIYVSMREL